MPGAVMADAISGPEYDVLEVFDRVLLCVHVAEIVINLCRYIQKFLLVEART